MAIANHEYYVSLEVAKLLKEAGFDWEVNHSYPNISALDNSCSEYMEDLSFYHNLNDGKYGGLSVPTLEVAQRWLREEKNLILLIDMAPSYCNGKPMGYKFVIHVSCGNHIFGEWKDTYEEALEAGIKKALEIILEKGE